MDDQFDTAANPTANANRDKIAGIVRSWMEDNIHGSPISRDTETFNHLAGSLNDLVDRLDKAVTLK